MTAGTPPSPRPSLSDSLTAGVLALIREEMLEAGDAMPTVKQLASRFHVTAPTIREALRRLETTGAVQLRHGSGVYVGPDVHRVVLANPHAGRISPQTALQLIEARLVIEPGVAEAAAATRTDADLERLRQASRTAKRSGDVAVEKSLSFHRMLAAASGNSVLHEVVDSLLTVHGHEQRRVRRMLVDRQRDYEQHCEIVEAVATGDGTRAREVMQVHLVDIRDVVRQALPEPGGLPA